jgi:hypothetical protein
MDGLPRGCLTHALAALASHARHGEDTSADTRWSAVQRLENGLRCATGTSSLVAQTKRKSTRKPSANQRANHFPNDIRYFRNEAQTILPVRANHFASSRKPFCQFAQTILPAAQTICPCGASHFLDEVQEGGQASASVGSAASARTCCKFSRRCCNEDPPGKFRRPLRSAVSTADQVSCRASWMRPHLLLGQVPVRA